MCILRISLIKFSEQLVEESRAMKSDNLQKLILALGVIITFRFLDYHNWFFVHYLVVNYNFSSWLFYPPAFLRLFAFLIFGYTSIPILFLAQLWGVDFGLSRANIVIVSAFMAIGGPLGVDLASKITSLKPSLGNLTPLRLLILSLACAAGNAAFMKMGLSLADFEKSKMPDYLSIVIGDTVGTWVMIYLIKTALTLYGRSLKN